MKSIRPIGSHGCFENCSDENLQLDVMKIIVTRITIGCYEELL